jgi:Domain of unknown function (DUF4112)
MFPGLGDAITSAISLLIVHHAWQTGASSLVLARKLANIDVDFMLGAVPLAGDALDFAWKANRKNARLFFVFRLLLFLCAIDATPTVC